MCLSTSKKKKNWHFRDHIRQQHARNSAEELNFFIQWKLYDVLGKCRKTCLPGPSTVQLLTRKTNYEILLSWWYDVMYLVVSSSSPNVHSTTTTFLILRIRYKPLMVTYRTRWNEKAAGNTYTIFCKHLDTHFMKKKFKGVSIITVGILWHCKHWTLVSPKLEWAWQYFTLKGD